MKTGSGKGADPGFGTRLCCMFSAQKDARAVSPSGKHTLPVRTLQICSVVLGVLVLLRLMWGVIV